MDNRRFALCHARFFVAQMPETALRINQSNRKAGNVNESESEKEVR